MKTLTIQHIAKLTGLSVHTLRYYEKIGLLNGVKRDSSGYRQYSEADVDWIRFLLRLRETGMPISEMKRFSDLRSQGESTTAARLEMLEHHRWNVQKRIAKLGSHLEKIGGKIDYYKTFER
ncbi:MerR family transcriptional regulator [Paenibacillus frigoriresistens]|uniref:MerR family transcriptional regulator n=1 Tax=Paenibacillus alginolyticus TaxID=59839 RepID=UPI0015661A6A|nr:MerR family transcriptional regulator [Paenibacillus frigoriresistens]NRF95778.1 MerR family transcriptional regulator [Paenibacillus frigoriresistens]